MRGVAVLLALLTAALAACAAPAPERREAPSLSFRLAADPVFVLDALREEAVARGFRIASESSAAGGVDLIVDFGVRPRIVALPDGAGDVTPRTTEVHSSARYRVEPVAEPASATPAAATSASAMHAAPTHASRPARCVVTFIPSTAWWHPDRRAWFEGPAGEVPGLDLLTGAVALP